MLTTETTTSPAFPVLAMPLSASGACTWLGRTGGNGHTLVRSRAEAECPRQKDDVLTTLDVTDLYLTLSERPILNGCAGDLRPCGGVWSCGHDHPCAHPVP